jgi:cell division protein FtsQ
MRQLSFNDRLAPRRAAAGNRPGRPRRGRTAWPRGLRQRARLLAGLGVVVGVVVAGGWWLVQPGNGAMLTTGARQIFLRATAGMGMTVENVYSLGHREAKPEAILAALEINRGDPILGFAPTQARTRLLALDWVESAIIERRLPNTIRVKIVERRPFALWQHDRHITLVDRGGAIINARDVPRFGHLPLIVGADAPAKAPALFDILRTEPDLFHRLVSAVWVGSRRWDLHFDSGLLVRFPEIGAATAWRRLVRLLGADGLREERFVSIDLRLPDRAILGPRRGGAMDGSST